jgi:hypothetical protein
MKQAASNVMVHAGFLLGSFQNPDDGGDIFLRNGIHFVILEKTELFITTAAGTSNSTSSWLVA